MGLRATAFVDAASAAAAAPAGARGMPGPKMCRPSGKRRRCAVRALSTALQRGARRAQHSASPCMRHLHAPLSRHARSAARCVRLLTAGCILQKRHTLYIALKRVGFHNSKQCPGAKSQLTSLESVYGLITSLESITRGARAHARAGDTDPPNGTAAFRFRRPNVLGSSYLHSTPPSRRAFALRQLTNRNGATSVVPGTTARRRPPGPPVC